MTDLKELDKQIDKAFTKLLIAIECEEQNYRNNLRKEIDRLIAYCVHSNLETYRHSS